MYASMYFAFDRSDHNFAFHSDQIYEDNIWIPFLQHAILLAYQLLLYI